MREDGGEARGGKRRKNGDRGESGDDKWRKKWIEGRIGNMEVNREEGKEGEREIHQKIDKEMIEAV